MAYVAFDEKVKPDGLLEMHAENAEAVKSYYLTREILKGMPLVNAMIDESLLVQVPTGFQLVRVNLNAGGTLSSRLTENDQVSLHYNKDGKTVLYARGLRMAKVYKDANQQLQSAEFLMPVAKVSSFMSALSQDSFYLIDAKPDVDLCYRNEQGGVDPYNGLWCSMPHPKPSDLETSKTGDAGQEQNEVAVDETQSAEIIESSITPMSTMQPVEKPVTSAPKATSGVAPKKSNESREMREIPVEVK